MSEVYVALLRGVNVGGKNKLPMIELEKLFLEVGCENVKTFIQSGNVVFRAKKKVADDVPTEVAALILNRFGLKTPVLVRSVDELRLAFEGNPFLLAGAAPESLFLMFLAEAPKAEAVSSLDPNRSPGDRYEVIGKEIYLALGTGAADTKLTNQYFDSRLSTVSTSRNWRTVEKLLTLAQSI